MIDKSSAEKSFSTDKSGKTPSWSVTISKRPATDPVDDSRNNFLIFEFMFYLINQTHKDRGHFLSNCL